MVVAGPMNEQPRVEVWWIRHGESVRNAGHRTLDTYSAPVTSLGSAQARRVAERLERSPDLLLHSLFLRASQTAAAISDLFPSAPIETWDIHEFHFLCDQRTRNTTRVERDPMVLEYWERGDPDHVSGVGAESFRGFIGRVDRAIQRLRSAGKPWIVACSHQQFIQGVVFRLAHVNSFGPTAPDRNLMQDFRVVVETSTVPNGGLVRMSLATESGGAVAGVDRADPALSLDQAWPAAPDSAPRGGNAISRFS